MNPQTPTDAFVLQQIAPLLGPGEQVISVGYLPPTISSGRAGAFIDAATKMAAFAALTDRRILFVQTRIGAFAPLLENHGVRPLDRAAIKGVFVGDELYIELFDGTMITYQAKRSVKEVSTQQAFFQMLTSSFPPSEMASQVSSSNQQTRYITLAIGIMLAGVYAWYHFRH